MEEYKEWLESRITTVKELAENSVKARSYSAADTYFTRASAYKECLCMLEHFDKKDKKVNFNSLGVGKKYVSVFEDGTFSDVFVVLSKGCDDKGDYVWNYNVSNDEYAHKVYEQTFNTVKYFKEVQ